MAHLLKQAVLMFILLAIVSIVFFLVLGPFPGPLDVGNVSPQE